MNQAGLPPCPLLCPLTSSKRLRRSLGFTLVEVLVALFLLSLVSVLAWQSMDGLRSTQTALDQHVNQVSRLQNALLQWHADLDAVLETGQTPPFSYDGRLFRLTRRDGFDAARGVRVVAWVARLEGDGLLQWSRWQSVLLQTPLAISQAWQQANAWSRSGMNAAQQNANTNMNTNGAKVLLIKAWRLFYFRQNAWTNPLSDPSDAAVGVQAASMPANGQTSPPWSSSFSMPSAIRLEVDLGQSQNQNENQENAALSGTIRDDWISPALERPRS
jgi:general secretion pathway protein J